MPEPSGPEVPNWGIITALGTALVAASSEIIRRMVQASRKQTDDYSRERPSNPHFRLVAGPSVEERLTAVEAALADYNHKHQQNLAFLDRLDRGQSRLDRGQQDASNKITALVITMGQPAYKEWQETLAKLPQPQQER